MFLSFSKKSQEDFERFVQTVAGISTSQLSSLHENVTLKSPINFFSLHYHPTPTGSRNDQPPSKPSSHQSKNQSRPQPQPNTERQRKQTPQRAFGNQQNEPEAQVNIGALVVPQLDNPSNNCWLNSVMQMALHVVKHKGDAQTFFHNPSQEQLRPYATAFAQILQKLRSPGKYSVNSLTGSPRRISFKQMILLSMNITATNQLHAQQDAAECLQAILGFSQELQFLWHIMNEKIQCNHCGQSTTTSVPNSIATVDIAYLVRNKSFDAAAAIKNHFEATEHGIDRQCESCHGHTCSKSGHLQFAPKFLVVQLKRFMTKQLRQSVSHFKENAEALPFTEVVIDTLQGQATYKVFSAVHHIGRQRLQGHYIAYLREDDCWLLCNDEQITPLPADTNEPMRNAYLVILVLSED